MAYRRSRRRSSYRARRGGVRRRRGSAARGMRIGWRM